MRPIGKKILLAMEALDALGVATVRQVAANLTGPSADNARTLLSRCYSYKMATCDIEPETGRRIYRPIPGWRDVVESYDPRPATPPAAPARAVCPQYVVRPGIGTFWQPVRAWGRGEYAAQ